MAGFQNYRLGWPATLRLAFQPGEAQDMMQNEKERLIALFADKRRWCQQVEARDATGEPVCYDHEQATAWDVVGGMCLLFGWERARRLFPHVGRNVAFDHRRLADLRDPEVAAMSALLDFNDEGHTTHALILARLREMPVYYCELAPSAGS